MMDIKSKLLDEILNCPDVEWKPLGQVLVRTKGTQITASKMKELHKDNAPLKIFAGGKTVAYFNFEDIPEKDINREPSIIVKSRGVIEFEYYDQPFSHKNEMWSYHSQDKNVEVKYVYYFLKCNEDYFQKIGSKMQMPQISTPDTEKYLIPIPPLQIQQKIVDILDKFTKLTAELTAELTARKQQYEYYRDELLTFGDDVEWKELNEIAEIKRGVRLVRSQLFEDAEYPVYQNSMKPLGYYDQSNVSSNTAFVIGAGAAGEIGYSFTDFWAADDCFYFECSSVLQDRYLYHVLVNQKTYISSQVRRSSIPRLARIVLEKVRVPIPSIDKQAQIVEILDKFDALTNSITEGLPREIELRQQQYEYYRDLLLSFPKPDGVK